MPTQNLDKKFFSRSSVQSIPLYTSNCMSWNPIEREIPQSSSKDASFKVEFTPQVRHDVKHLGLQLLPDQGSSSTTQTISQSQDRCNSSESGIYTPGVMILV